MGPGSIIGNIAGALRGGSTVGRAVVELVTDNSQATKGFTQFQAQSSAAAAKSNATWKSSFAGLGTYAKAGFAIAGAAAVAGIAKAISAASDLNEATNVANVTFRSAAESVIAFTSEADKIGLAQADALQAASAFGNMAQGMGIARDESARMATGMVQLAADMGSFFNVDPTEMLERIRSGLAGEIEPLRRFGVSLDAAAVEQFALNNGIAQQGQEMTQAEKFMARYGLLLEKTKNSQGDFARTLGESLPNQMRALRGELTNTAAAMGEQLLPVATSVIGAFRGMFTVVAPILQFLAANTGTILAFAAAWGALRIVQAVAGWMSGLAAANATTTATIATQAVTVAQGTVANEAYGASFRTLAADAALATTNLSRFTVGAAGAATTAAQGATRQMALPAIGRTTPAVAVGTGAEAGKIAQAAQTASVAWTKAGGVINSTISGIGRTAKGVGGSIAGFLSQPAVGATVAIVGVLSLIKTFFSEILADADSVAAGFKDSFGQFGPEGEQIARDFASGFEDEFDTFWQSGLVGGEAALESTKKAMTIVGEEGAKALQAGLSGAQVGEALQQMQDEITAQAGGFGGGFDAIRQTSADTFRLLITEQGKAMDAIAKQTDQKIDLLNATTEAGLDRWAALAGQSTQAFSRDFVSGLKEADDAGAFMQEFVQSQREALEEWQTETAQTINFVSGSLSSLGDRANLSANDVIQSFQKQRDAMNNFGQDLLTIAKRGGAAGKDLSSDLLAMGEAGVGVANTIAGANDKQFKRITGIWQGAGKDADSLAAKLSDALIGTLKDLKSILIDLVRQFDKDYEFKATANTTDAKNDLAGLADSIVKQGFQLVGQRTGIRHSGGWIDQSLPPGPEAGERMAVLQQDEFVVRRKEAKKPRNRMILEAMNRGKDLPHYHFGGAVTGDSDVKQEIERLKMLKQLKQQQEVIANIGLQPGAWEQPIPTGEVPGPWGGFANGRIPLSAMTNIGGSFYLEPTAAAAFKAAGATLSGVTSAYRTYGQQAGLYSTVTGPVAPPGQSMHGWGKAVDSSIGSQAWNALHGPGRQFNWRSGSAFGDPVHHSWGTTARKGGFLRKDSLVSAHKGETITNPRDPENMRAMRDAYIQATRAQAPVLKEAFKEALRDKQFLRELRDAMSEVHIEMKWRDDKITRAQDRRRTIRSG